MAAKRKGKKNVEEAQVEAANEVEGVEEDVLNYDGDEEADGGVPVVSRSPEAGSNKVVNMTDLEPGAIDNRKPGHIVFRSLQQEAERFDLRVGDDKYRSTTSRFPGHIEWVIPEADAERVRRHFLVVTQRIIEVND